MQNKVALIILDGRWVTSDEHISAPAQAQTPFLDALKGSVPYTELMASEEAVGLPVGQVGNSEVGHSTLWTGRVHYQNLVRINNAIKDLSFFEQENLFHAIEHCWQKQWDVHLLCLLSDGGVHSHIDHLFAMIDCIELQRSKSKFAIWTCYIHVISDGRDTDPESLQGYMQQLQEKIKGKNFVIVDMIGRYYAMDRDHRRERTKEAYDLYVHGRGSYQQDIWNAIQTSYHSWITDEFIKATRFLSDPKEWVIVPGDMVVFLNFRSDRARQLTSCLVEQDYLEYHMKAFDWKALVFFCMTEYDASFQHVQVLFPPISLEQTLGQVLSSYGKTQLRIAETEKYPHVSFFFNAGVEAPYPWEERILIASPKVATYDLQPEMSAKEVTQACIEYVKQKSPDFICLNYANPDMVGHTGNFDAVVEACEAVDTCLSKLVPFLTEQGYTSILIADHGNADVMKNPDGSPNTAHSLALAPCRLLNGPDAVKLEEGWSLADIAPTILSLMDIEIPKEMTGRSLI
jgi:2,3-bisphosphoglycerate-independent phosphoglycerate mutase